jgi:hypothetical protein
MDGSRVQGSGQPSAGFVSKAVDEDHRSVIDGGDCPVPHQLDLWVAGVTSHVTESLIGLIKLKLSSNAILNQVVKV